MSAIDPNAHFSRSHHVRSATTSNPQLHTIGTPTSGFASRGKAAHIKRLNLNPMTHTNPHSGELNSATGLGIFSPSITINGELQQEQQQPRSATRKQFLAGLRTVPRNSTAAAAPGAGYGYGYDNGGIGMGFPMDPPATAPLTTGFTGLNNADVLYNIQQPENGSGGGGGNGNGHGGKRGQRRTASFREKNNGGDGQRYSGYYGQQRQQHQQAPQLQQTFIQSPMQQQFPQSPASIAANYELIAQMAPEMYSLPEQGFAPPMMDFNNSTINANGDGNMNGVNGIDNELLMTNLLLAQQQQRLQQQLLATKPRPATRPASAEYVGYGGWHWLGDWDG
ncbi:hypothetical protein KEM55_006312 [Ascosphaera atra]|nr:hypothetical protein KEM55_006312 [Ascosphaera atra]